ncbi:MAG: hypothetical protein WCK90_03390 [archaeon]
MKKGQVSIFVIVAIVIVAVILGIYFLQGNLSQQSDKNLSPEAQQVKGYVDECLKTTLTEGIITIGEQGGYNTLPEKSNTFFFFAKPYYFSGKQASVPGKDVLEKEITAYIQDNVDACLENFSYFDGKGMKISKGTNKAIVKINGLVVSAQLTSSVNIDAGGSASSVKDFSASVSPVRFDTLLAASNDIASSETKDPRTMCLSCIKLTASTHGINVEILDTNDRNEYIFQLVDEQSNFSGTSYDYKFAGRYTFPDCTSLEDCQNALSSQ